MRTSKHTRALNPPPTLTEEHVSVNESTSKEEDIFIIPERSPERRCPPSQQMDDAEAVVQQRIAQANVKTARTELQSGLVNGTQQHVHESTTPLALQANKLLPPQAAASTHEEAPLPPLSFEASDMPIYLVKQRITKRMLPDASPRVEEAFMDNFATAHILFANQTAIDLFAELTLPRTSDDPAVQATRLQHFKNALKNWYGIDNQKPFRGRKATTEQEVVVWVIAGTFKGSGKA